MFIQLKIMICHREWVGIYNHFKLALYLSCSDKRFSITPTNAKHTNSVFSIKTAYVRPYLQ